MVRAATPTPGTAPVTWRCTRYVALHPLRGATPDQNGCIAYGSGAAPTLTSPNADTHTSPRTGHAPPTTATHYLDRHCATYSPAQRPPSSATLPLTSPTAARVATTQGTTSTTGHCTRYVALHPLRGATPVQNGCIAYGSGAPPTPTSPNADTHTSPGAGSAPSTTATHCLDRHCATYSPAQRPPSSATLPLTSPTAARVATTQGTTSTTGHCTRYVALHPLRSAAPVQNGCIAYRSGALPTDRVQRPHSQAQPWTTAPCAPTSTQRQQAQHNETTAAPARMADNTPSRTTSPTYRIEDSTLFEYKPHRTRAQTRKHTPNPSPQPSVVGRRKPQKIDSPRPP